jgi:hypothetical protein
MNRNVKGEKFINKRSRGKKLMKTQKNTWREMKKETRNVVKITKRCKGSNYF